MINLKPENNIVYLSNRTEKHSVVEISDTSIIIAGKVSSQEYIKHFKLNDIVFFDSGLNCSCTGRLKRIYKDFVLIASGNEIHRETLYNFAKRNWNSEN